MRQTINTIKYSSTNFDFAIGFVVLTNLILYKWEYVAGSFDLCFMHIGLLESTRNNILIGGNIGHCQFSNDDVTEKGLSPLTDHNTITGICRCLEVIQYVQMNPGEKELNWRHRNKIFSDKSNKH